MEPYQPTMPLEPPQYAQPTEPTEYASPYEPDSARYAPPDYKAAQPAQYVQPLENVQHVQAVGPGQPAQPVEPVQYIEPVQPAITPAPPPISRAYWRGRIIYLALSILETLLVIRLFLKLFGANSAAPFSALIYGLTTPFVLPFEGVFPQPSAQGSVFDLAALLALIIYPIVAWIILRILQATSRRTVA